MPLDPESIQRDPTMVEVEVQQGIGIPIQTQRTNLHLPSFYESVGEIDAGPAS